MAEQFPSGRRYDLDWLRVIAILLLLFYHAGMTFNTWEWHIKNSETSKLFNYWMLPLHYIRMPLLLFISGAATYMALGKRTIKGYAGERFKRLVIPYVFGLVVMGPTMVYFEYGSQITSYWDIYKSFFDFIPYHNGMLNWYHFWFIGHLFVYSLIVIPVLIFLRSPNSERFKSGIRRILLRPIAMLLVPAAIILITQVLFRPGLTGPFEGWRFFAYYFCFFLFGIICYSSPEVPDSVLKNRKYFLTASLVILFIRFVGFFFKDTSATTVATIEAISIFLSWIWVITIIAYGQHYLNIPGKFLARFTEAAYPFYLLHQPFLIAISYYICQLPWGISAKYIVLCLLTLVAVISFYLVFVKPFNVMRFLFGMKPKRRVGDSTLFVR